MSVITRANKAQGQAVKTFVAPGSAPHQPDKPPRPEAAADPLKAKAEKMAMLKNELLGLDKTERELLLSQLFAAELEHIVKLEQEKGFDRGTRQAKEQWLEKEQELKTALEQQQQKWVDDLDKAVETFSGTKPVVELKDEAILVDIVYSAVLKIIEVQLAEGEYVREVIRSLADEFSGQETLELCLCSRDLHILNELNLNSLLPANMKVVEEDNLMPGSYRIHIEGGAIESKLDEKLKNFKSVLIDTYNRQREEV